MTNASAVMDGSAVLSPEDEQKLIECYCMLRELAASCQVPAVLAAVDVAVVELDVALAGQAVETEDLVCPVI